MSMKPEEIDVDDIPYADLRDVFEALFDYLRVKVIREQTPDYTAYTIEAK